MGMRYLPLFLDLHGCPVTLIGAGTVALRKARLLTAAGARLTVLAPAACTELAGWAEAGRLTWQAVPFSTEALLATRPRLVIAATSDPAVNAAAADCCRARDIWINVVDAPAFSDAIFPAIVDRSPLMVAVSSGGAAPVLARQVRARLETLLPAGLGRLADAAEALRPAVKQRLTDPEQRRRFWEQALQAPSTADALAGHPEATVADWQQQLAGAGTTAAEGEILIVGCGSGAPDELTLRGLQYLQRAGLLAHPATIAEPVLALARRDADRLLLDLLRPDDWLPHLAGLARNGQRITLLLPGDGRQGGEWMTYWRNAGLRVSRALGVQAD